MKRQRTLNGGLRDFLVFRPALDDFAAFDKLIAIHSPISSNFVCRMLGTESALIDRDKLDDEVQVGVSWNGARRTSFAVAES